MKNYYQINKEKTRQQAIDWQQWSSENAITWAKCVYITDIFEKKARKYGLIKEFKENGII